MKKDSSRRRSLRWLRKPLCPSAGSSSTTVLPTGQPRLSNGIQLVSLDRAGATGSNASDRSFSGKVGAFNAGLERVRSLQFEVIGNLDADLSFEPDYLEFLMGSFQGIRDSESPERPLLKTVATTQPEIALKARITLREDASCFGINVSGNWRLRAKPGRRSRLDCRHVCANERLECTVLSGKEGFTIIALWERRNQRAGRELPVWRTSLLSGWLSDLASVPLSLPND